MTDLDLKLGDPPGGRRRAAAGRGGPLLLGLVAAAQVVILAKLFLPAWTPGPAGRPADAARTKSLALSLEEKSVSREAALEWERYAEQAPQDPDRPQILFRAGKLRVDAHDDPQAARDFIAAEQAAQEKGVKLEGNTAERIVECLRRMGLYGEVGRELARRADLGGPATTSKVLATYAGEKITEADVDRMVEERVDQLIRLRHGDPSQREGLLRQLGAPEARRQVLQELLQTELLARSAREIGLDREDSYRRALQSAESQMLASAMLDRELSKIQPTAVDVESYFSSHREEFREPEAAKVAVLELKDGAPKSAEEVRKSGHALEIQKGRGDPFEAALSMKPGELAVLEDRGQKAQVLVLEHSDSRIPELGQIKDRVAHEYVARKRGELSERISRDLMFKYDVKIQKP